MKSIKHYFFIIVYAYLATVVCGFHSPAYPPAARYLSTSCLAPTINKQEWEIQQGISNASKDAIANLSNSDVYNFAKLFLQTRYTGTAEDNALDLFQDSQYKSAENYVESLLQYMLINRDNPLQVLQEGRKIFIDAQQLAPIHKKIYQRNAQLKYRADASVFFSIIESCPPNATIADIGAGSNRFLNAVFDLSQEQKRTDMKFIGSDISLYGNPIEKQPYLQFRLQRKTDTSPVDPYYLPFENQSCDVVVFRAALHHISELDRILEQVCRILKPGGRLVLIEDSFENGKKENYNNTVDPKLQSAFNKLTPQQKLAFLRFNDWYANFFYHEWTGMPLPFNHKHASEWGKDIRQASGSQLQPADIIDVGFYDKNLAVHQPATAFITFSRADTATEIAQAA